MKNGRLPLLHFCEGFRAIPRTAADKLRNRFVDEVGHVAGRPASAPPRRFRASVTSQDTFFNRKLRLFGNISKTDGVSTTKLFWDVTRSLGRFVVVAGARATSSGEAIAFFFRKIRFFGNTSKIDDVTTTKFFSDVTRTVGRPVVVAGARATFSGEATAFFLGKNRFFNNISRINDVTTTKFSL